MDYREQILKKLVEKYRKSKKDSGTNRINRKTNMKPDSVYPQYYENDGEISSITEVNEAVCELHEAGFVNYTKERFSHEIKEIILRDEMILDAEQYLRERYGYQTKGDRIRYIEQLIADYEQASPVAEICCQKLREKLAQNKLGKDYSEEEDLLKTLAFVENNHTPLFLREVSMLLFGDSKYLEKHVLTGLCKALRSYWKRPCGEHELGDEILEEYGIQRETPKPCFKGACLLTMADGSTISTDGLFDGIQISSSDSERIAGISVHAKQVITIENKTAYERFSDNSSLIVYLGGYVTRRQRDFLKKMNDDNERLEWFHFGDIDAGGFYIHDHLCRMTGIPFKTLFMGIKELQNPCWKACLKPLSKEDNRRLKALVKQPEYQKTASYMLEHQVKLEQEIICYDWMKREWENENLYQQN